MNRPKTAFTKNYEFDEQIRLDSKPSDTMLAPIDPSKIKKEKKRSKSKNRRNSSRNRSPLPLPDVRQDLEKSRDRSSSNSRIATGDTGYDSISNLSLKSLESFNQHQPKIFSSTSTTNSIAGATASLGSSSLASTTNYLTNNSFTIANRPVSVSVSQHLNSKPTLKNLKNNLTPLSAIKLNPK